MNKNVVTIVFVGIICLLLAIGVFILLSPKNTDTKDNEESNITIDKGTEDTTQEDTKEEIPAETPECPEGIVCIGGSDIPELPNVKLGTSEVYAADLEEESEPQDQETDADSSTHNTTEGNTDILPLNVTVTNQDYRTWSIFWITNTIQTGYIKYGTVSNTLNRKGFDERDPNSTNLAERFTHHISVRNTDEDLEKDNLAFYFKIVSGDTEFDDNGNVYTYENASLTSSPSTPNSITVATNLASNYDKNDYVVLTMQTNNYDTESNIVSGVFTDQGGVDISIGIARNKDLKTYFGYSSTNKIDVKVYGPNGYTGYAGQIDAGKLENENLNVRISQTGYEGDIFSASIAGDYTFEDKSGTVSENENNDSNLPRTGFEKEWLFTSVFGLVIMTLGIFCVLIVFPLNYKKLWEKKVIDDIDGFE